MGGTRWLAYFQCTLAMAMGGAVVVAGKFLTHAFPVFLAAGLRLLMAVPVLVALVLIREGRLPKLTGREALALFVLGVEQAVCFFALPLEGLGVIEALHFSHDLFDFRERERCIHGDAPSEHRLLPDGDAPQSQTSPPR